MQMDSFSGSRNHLGVLPRQNKHTVPCWSSRQAWSRTSVAQMSTGQCRLVSRGYTLKNYCPAYQSRYKTILVSVSPQSVDQTCISYSAHFFVTFPPDFSYFVLFINMSYVRVLCCLPSALPSLASVIDRLYNVTRVLHCYFLCRVSVFLYWCAEVSTSTVLDTHAV